MISKASMASYAFGLRIPLLMLLFINTLIVASYYMLYTARNHIVIQTEQQESLTTQKGGTTDYGHELTGLMSKVGTPTLDTTVEVIPEKFLNDTEDPTAWTHQNTLYQDPRLAISLTLNSIQHQVSKNETPSLPFNWADWVDLTYLNSELDKPVDKRTTCEDIKGDYEYTKPEDRERAKKENEFVQCIDNDDITPKMLSRYGFDAHQKVPGFIYFGYCLFKTNERNRLLQGKTFLLTNAPNPYKIMFLNDHGEDLIFDVTSKQRIVSSGLMNHYVENNEVSESGTLVLNPLREFQALANTLGRSLNDDPPYSNFSALKNLSPAMFHYSDGDIDSQMTLYKRLAGTRELTIQEQSYLTSLELSKERNSQSEDVYFRMSSMLVDKENSDNGWHYDWRFFNGKLVDNQRTSIILERLMRNWFKFATKYDMISWIMHGPLLSWYWSGGMFPYDNDLDIQMPIEHLVRLGELYNQTLVVEDLNEGYGKYLIDVGTFVHNRDISKNSNHIDARFIDVDTGIYIDITGLSTSKEKTPSSYYKNINNDVEEGAIMSKEEDATLEVYNDRRLHFYHFDHLSPLKMSMLSGVPTYIPNEIIRRLKFEYPNGGVTNYEHKDWYFVPRLQNWVHQDQLLSVVEVNDYRTTTSDGSVVEKPKLVELAKNITDSQLFTLLANDESMSLDYSRSQELNRFHTKELDFLVAYNSSKPLGKNDPLDKGGKMIDNPEVYDDIGYSNLVSKYVRLHEPIRMSLFEYERFKEGQKKVQV